MGPGRAQDRTQTRVWMAPPKTVTDWPFLIKSDPESDFLTSKVTRMWLFQVRSHFCFGGRFGESPKSLFTHLSVTFNFSGSGGFFREKQRGLDNSWGGEYIPQNPSPKTVLDHPHDTFPPGSFTPCHSLWRKRAQTRQGSCRDGKLRVKRCF